LENDSVAGTDEGDDDIPEEAVLHAIRWGVRGWHAGRGPGQEPREAPGEFKALLAARMAAAERVLEDLERLGARKFPREDAPSDTLKRALLRAFDLGWRAGRAFEWERRERSPAEPRQKADAQAAASSPVPPQRERRPEHETLQKLPTGQSLTDTGWSGCLTGCCA
jgi:hypothetical protein